MLRKSDKDYYYQHKWKDLLENNNISRNTVVSTNNTAGKSKDHHYDTTAHTKNNSISSIIRVLTAFSQDQQHKLYVQRVVREADNFSLIATHILERGGAVYIAGGAKMTRAVKDEFVECLAKY